MSLSKPSSSVSSGAKPTWVRWQIVAFVMLFVFFGHFNRISLTVAADLQIMKEYRIEPEWMGTIYSTFLLTYTLCMIPGGLLIDRIGVRHSLALMALGLAVAAGVTGLVGKIYGPYAGMYSAGLFASLLVIRALMGVVAAPLHPSGARAVGHWIPLGAQTWANGLITGMSPLGVGATYVVFGAMVTRFDWPNAFLMLAAATAVLAAVWWLFATDHPHHHRRVNEAEIGLIRAGKSIGPPESEVEEDLAELKHEMVEATLPYEAPSTSQRPLWRDRNLVLLTLSYALNGYFQYLFFYWIHFYFGKILKLESSSVDFYSSLPPLAMAVGMPLGGLIADLLQPRIGRYRSRACVAIVGMTLGALFLCFGLATEQPTLIVAWFALAQGSVGLSESSFWATVIDSEKERSGAATAFLNTGGNAGGMLAPIVTPWAGKVSGSWTVAIALGGVASFAAAILWLWVKPPAELSTKSVTRPAVGT